jgi:hypothetical protein
MDSQDQQQQIDKILNAEPREVPYRSPWKSGGGKPISEAEYNTLLNERLSEVGQWLDMQRANIKTPDHAHRWVKFKRDVASAKAMTNPYKKIDVVLDLEKRANNNSY